MAFSYGFFNSKGLDRTYTAENFCDYLGSIICNGIQDNFGTQFRLVAGSGLSVKLGTGKAWINGHYFISDATYTIDLSSYLDESLPRYVGIAIVLNAAESARNITIEVTPGTPAENPSLPSYPVDNNKTRLLMYAVRMNPGATSLTDRDWYDYREDRNVCGYCQCILGKCKVTDILTQLSIIKQIMNENNDSITELTHKVDELQIKVDDLTGDVIQAGMLGDNIYYVMYSNGSVTVRGTGDMYDYHITDKPSPLMKNNEIKSVVISEGITSVGEYVFENNENMTSVSLPSTLRTIGHASFMQGDDYIGVVHGIESIIIPPQVTSIGRSAFWGTAITSIHIPATVTEIGKYAFRDCACLETVRNDSKLIGEFMFVGCSKLATLLLTSRLERIHGDAFNYCKKLTTIIYDGTVTQWQAVQKASDWACKIGMEVGISGLTTVECSDGHFEYNTESKEWEVFMND